MRQSVVFAGILLLAAAASAQTREEPATERAAIRQNVDAYVEAFNRGDAAAVAAFWTETGEWYSPSGRRLVGPQQIQDAVQEFFDAGEPPTLVLSTPRLRLIAPTVAMEEGTARVVRKGEETTESHYLAIHVKQGDRWMLESIRETLMPAAPSNYEHLKPLEWLVGSWIDKDGDISVNTKVEWTRNKNFLTRSFRVQMGEETEMEGTQIIGWDAAAGQIRSWMFDSNGSIAEAVWKQEEGHWTIKTSQVMSDGARASSINILKQLDENSMSWESIGREVDGEIQPNIGPVTVIRSSE